MKSLSSLGLALSVVFTCLLFALIAEIYYLLWWKNRIIRANQIDNVYTFCCSNKLNSTNAPHQSPIDESNSKDYLVKPLDDCCDYEDCVIEKGLISGPPRFLFTIKEETKEDLLDSELDNGKIRSSLSDLLVKTVETPYTTPLCSPPFLTPMGSSHSSNSGCSYNPFYEASSDVEFSRMVKASPPPKFKFLRDAEEKLRRRAMLVEEEGNEGGCNYGEEEGQDGNFITVIVANCNNK